MNNATTACQRRLKDENKIAVWSIGIYTGETLFDLKPNQEIRNPVIAAQNVSDATAVFVADPFMIKVEGTWHMFFEVMNAETGKGEIGLATSNDGMMWNYRQIVLREPFHLSYPYAFSLDGEYYLIPEAHDANSIRIYRADPFPDKWSLLGSLMDGAWADPSIFSFDGRWWMFASPTSPRNDTLNLFYSETICGPWVEHRMNPIVKGNNQIARPGGRVIVREDKAIRFAQDCNPYYGTRVRAFEVSQLTTSTYREREADQSPILSAGEQAWHRSGMHHIDPHFADGRWLACVDGWRPVTLNLEKQFSQYGGAYEAEAF